MPRPWEAMSPAMEAVLTIWPGCFWAIMRGTKASMPSMGSPRSDVCGPGSVAPSRKRCQVSPRRCFGILARMDFRLPATVVPARYDVRLEPDLEAAIFTGEEIIAVAVKEPVTEIVLNAAELQIESVAIEGAGGPVVQGSAALDEANERARLLFPAPIAPGEWRLKLRFRGTLNERLHGFYRSTYSDAAGGTHTI